MIGALVVAHGQLAKELVATACMIVGDLPYVRAVSIGWGDDVERSRAEIQTALKSVDRGKGALILTDMFGGTPSNISLTLMEKDRVEVITGVNLPMVIKLANQRENETAAEVAQRIRDQGKRSIALASEVLSSR
ncbi:MAG: PTS sugar transporter subunit IIA [Acidobacteria bacterium]|nr:PTS sugar transporter subunit IIA [Acidobacteriota bacterium]